eukprot:6187042-Pleurochrysis_carterae.AAC.1
MLRRSACACDGSLGTRARTIAKTSRGNRSSAATPDAPVAVAVLVAAALAVVAAALEAWSVEFVVMLTVGAVAAVAVPEGMATAVADSGSRRVLAALCRFITGAPTVSCDVHAALKVGYVTGYVATAAAITITIIRATTTPTTGVASCGVAARPLAVCAQRCGGLVGERVDRAQHELRLAHRGPCV